MAHSKKHKQAISKGLKAYHRGKSKKKKNKKYTASQRQALEKSKISKSGRKSWRERIKDSKKTRKSAGLWANYWSKKARVKHKQSLRKKKK